MDHPATQTQGPSYPDLTVTATDQNTASMSGGGVQLLQAGQPVGAVPEQYALPHAKAIDLIGEEFVPRMKTEPEDLSSEEPLSRPSVVMSVSAGPDNQAGSSDQGNLVYCNLNDLDFSSGEGGILASAISSLSNQNSLQEGNMTMTSANSGFLQMVQAVPGLQLATNDKSPYSAVSTILLQGGILQLKSDATGQISNIVANPQHNQGEQLAQVLHIPIDSKLGTQELLRGGAERMLPSQIVTCGGGSVSRPQDAIASILASMNSSGGHTVTTVGGQTIIQASGGEQPHQGHVSLASPVDYSTQVQDVVSVVSGLGDERAEMVPLNLATGSHQVSTIQQPQSVQVQGFKRMAQATPGGGIITKKVIIATINGTQRILTPVSSPQMIAVKSNTGGPPRILSDGTISNNHGTNLTIIQQKPVLQAGHAKPMLTNPNTASSSVSPQGVKSIDNKTCRWKFENGQICGKVFTKTYNLTVHMRMHQDIRPFPCTICEQTFRQKAHLQRHEATHGIDSTQGRKRRKKSLLEGLNESGLLGGRRQGGRMSESEEEEGEGMYRPYHEKRQKFSVGTMKTESDLDLDPMIEPIDGTAGPRKMCPVTVGTNTEITPDVREETYVDELEEDMEPVRYRTNQQGTTMQVEQGVQYCEADLLPQGGHFEQEDKFVPISAQTSIDAPQVAAMQTQVSMSEFMGEEGGQVVEMGEEEEGEAGKVMKTEMVYTSQGTHYVSDNHEYIEQEQDATHLLTADGSFIDASSNHLVMSDGGLVSLVNCVSGDTGEQQENVVNIVTSTATNEQGQQIVIIENLDQHSPELQREIMNALLADHTIVPISQ